MLIIKIKDKIINRSSRNWNSNVRNVNIFFFCIIINLFYKELGYYILCDCKLNLS